jgi:hypothetical protein
MIDRRLFTCAMSATLIGAPSRAFAQQPKNLPRVGVYQPRRHIRSPTRSGEACMTSAILKAGIS